MREVRFDDVDGLRALITTDFGPWGDEVEVTQAMIDAFAELTGDRQWIHVEPERARRESPFGGTIAHGFLTLSLLPRLHPRADVRITGHASASNYGSDRLRFLTPVPAGARLRARSRITDVQAKPNGTLVARETEIHVAGSERPAIVYVGLVLYQPPKSGDRVPPT